MPLSQVHCIPEQVTLSLFTFSILIDNLHVIKNLKLPVLKEAKWKEESEEGALVLWIYFSFPFPSNSLLFSFSYLLISLYHFTPYLEGNINLHIYFPFSFNPF